MSRRAIDALETERRDSSLDSAYRIWAMLGVPAELVFPNPHDPRSH